MLNKICIAGRLGQAPDLRHTQSGVANATFRVAVDRDFKDKATGEKVTDWIPVVTWRQTAEFCAKNLSKGRSVIVEGRLQMRDYTDKEGNKRTIAEVVADNVYFGDSKKDGDSGNSFTPIPQSNADDEFAEIDDSDSLPF